MKNLLLASTALVASTGFAMADVDISGSAEMGVFSDPTFNAPVGQREFNDLQFHTDINVVFTMAGETDAGLTFGAEVELSDVDGPGVGATDDDSDDGGVVIFVSGALGTLTMGDTDGAFDFALQEAIIGSSLRDNHEHAGYLGNSVFDGGLDGQVARYDYTFGDFSFAVSAEVGDNNNQISVNNGREPVLQVGVRYNGSFGGFDFGAGLGYGHQGDFAGTGLSREEIGVSLDTEVAGFQVILNYTDFKYDNNVGAGQFLGTSISSAGIHTPFLFGGTPDDHFGIAVGYTFGELLVAANYGKVEYIGGSQRSGFGLIANYELGGGAALEFGYGRNEFEVRGVNSINPGDYDHDTYSFGISMDF